jgi:hypothetical protein
MERVEPRSPSAPLFLGATMCPMCEARRKTPGNQPRAVSGYQGPARLGWWAGPYLVIPADAAIW